MDSNYEQNNSRLGRIGSCREFSEILGVNKATVSKAIKEGRLKQSLVIEKGNVRIAIAKGVLEWFRNTDQNKSSYKGTGSFKFADNLPSVGESDQYMKYLQAKSLERKDLEEEKKDCSG